MISPEYGISEINLDGFQLVQGNYFGRQSSPAMSIWYSSISFNAACYQALNECNSVQVLVNGNSRCILIKPVSSSDKDALTWAVPPEKHKYRKIECSKLTHQLFDLWKLNKELHYRTNGRLVVADKKVMLMFDFTAPEVWRGMKLVNEFER